MKKNIRQIALCVVLICAFTVQAFAASGNVGYAVYRDGVDIAWVNEWHAAMINKTSKTNSRYVVHANLGSDADYGDWDDFLHGVGNTSSNNEAQGVYRPKAGITSAQRDVVVETARDLVAEGIPYTFAGMMGYSLDESRDIIQPDEIAALRCDGVVEYCYEYNGHKIFGSGSAWNISINCTETYDAHHDNAWPSTQAAAMTRVGAA